MSIAETTEITEKIEMVIGIDLEDQEITEIDQILIKIEDIKYFFFKFNIYLYFIK